MITCMFEDGGNAMLRHVVVHAIVEKEHRILLVKRAPQLLEGGKWSLPSGFMEQDETAEQCVLRELREETGWTGNVVSFFRINSRPDRPGEDRQNVAIEFLVEAVEKVGDGDWESTDIAWFPIHALPPLDTLAFDHGESLGLYLQQKA